ncbi:hypothetical protein BGZ95_009963 [Linnemannia exigua]|uniref:C2H2-type domain-containing protein n=1 Tax=Linnemannia exigua TaxID=604196 RepID=A0AAD4DKC3_9FUNG|nr:hypothetical protein BGZ95_009963 [Linnemannia exigua]
MSLIDHSDQQQNHMATSALSAAAAAASSTGAVPLFVRSHSAPHVQLSAFHDAYMYNRSVQSINDQLTFQQQQQQQAGSVFRGGYPAESLQQFSSPHPFDQPPPLPQMASSETHHLQYPTGYTTASFQQNQPMLSQDLNGDFHSLPPSSSSSSGSVHPFQMDQLTSSINNLEAATAGSRMVKFGYNGMSDGSPSSSSSLSPSLTPSHHHHHAFHSLDRSQSMSIFDTSEFAATFEVPEEYPATSYLIQRHGSLGSLYPITQSHELLEPFHHHHHLSRSRLSSLGGTTMVPSLSSTSISSETSSTAFPSPSLAAAKSRTRRASLSPDGTTRVFTCLVDGCGKQFKRSEHLKRHVRSVHTLEKPFGCPYENCPKRFSRSDNLNQHIRIHRHEKEKAQQQQPKSFTSFTPFSPNQ